jgi:hypothetical protein
MVVVTITGFSPKEKPGFLTLKTWDEDFAAASVGTVRTTGHDVPVVYYDPNGIITQQMAEDIVQHDWLVSIAKVLD